MSNGFCNLQEDELLCVFPLRGHTFNVDHDIVEVLAKKEEFSTENETRLVPGPPEPCEP